jgi:hypothetical protein|tara:strand:- start:1621 stop:2745 length:1125 start_codon:yes stop_codon:yes gene_type:complete
METTEEEVIELVKSKVDSEENITILDIKTRILTLAEGIYGKENVEVKKLNEILIVTIRFPEFEIINGKQDHRTIKDLFVTFEVNSTISIASGLQGRRTTFSIEDILSNYVHSHLPSGDRDGNYGYAYSNFCTGSGPINNIARDMRAATGKRALRLLNAYIIHIRDYVKWESLQGGPHYRMESVRGNIRRFRTNRFNRYLFNVNINEMVPKAMIPLIQDALSDNVIIDVIQEGNQPVIKISWKKMVNHSLCEELSKMLIDKIHTRYHLDLFGYGNEKYPDIICTEIPPIEADNEQEHVIKRKLSNMPSLNFKGEEILTKCSDIATIESAPLTEEEQSKTEEGWSFIVHPKLVEYAMHEVENELHTFYLNNSIAKL